MILQQVKMAVKSICSNKMRSFLTMLGIIIGVMSLVVLVSLVNGAAGSITDSINALGSNMLNVTITDDHNAPVKMSELQQLIQGTSMKEAAPSVQTTVTASGAYAEESVNVTGTTASCMNIQGLTLVGGRFLMSPDVDNHSNVAVINAEMATDILGRSNVVGETIKLNGKELSVTERTREIGIRKAIGAGRGTIMLQFLTEALMVSLIGCFLGIIFSWFIIMIVNVAGGVEYEMSVGVAVLSIIFSVGIGVVFGIYPANKAAKMKPVDALRFN